MSTLGKILTVLVALVSVVVAVLVAREFVFIDNYKSLFDEQKVLYNLALDDRDKAIQRLTASLEVLRRQVDSGRPLPRFLLETQVLLGEVRLEGGETQEAVALFQPLVHLIQEEKPQTLDATTQHVFLGAVRAYSTLNDLDKAGKVSDMLINLGPDTRQVNDVLIDFAQRLNLERKKASAVVTRLESATNDQELNAAKV
ncbi:MAG: hypothetical protein NTX87_10310, partial [Planctomycetota bacterium]|nr:hypothetical protein [Planctomycetota bacterium]